MRFIVNIPDITKEAALALIHEPREALAVDIETVSLENRLPLGIAIAISGKQGFYFFNPHDELCKSMIAGTQTVIFHNAKFDLPILTKLGYNINNFEDTKLMAYAAGEIDNSLEALSQRILVRECPSVVSHWKKKDQGNVGIDHVNMGSISITHACNTYALYERIPKTTLYQEIDRPMLELLMEMEGYGLLIDQYNLTQLEQEVVERAVKLEEELTGELGDINLASNPQVTKALQDKGVIGTRKTKGGKTSISDESLRPLNHPIANKLLAYRKEMKTLTTYIPAFRTVDWKGRLHTSFGFTNTGRYSSSGPNLQNLTRNEMFEQFDE
jgi:DNA polymerase-1